MSGKSAAKYSAILLAVLLMMLSASSLRMVRLEGPMRNDEAFSYVSYVARGDYFDYSRPNNHVLNTLLMALFSEGAGNSPQVLRAPAYICGMLLLPGVAWLCFELCGSWLMALGAMALAASSTALVEYSVNARGYSLVCLAAVVMAAIGVRLRTRPGWKPGWALWALAGALGIYAVPTMVLAIAPLGLIFLADRWADSRPRVVPLLAAVAGLSLLAALLYAPVIAKNGLAALAGNSFVRPLPISQIPAQLIAALHDTVQMWIGPASVQFRQGRLGQVFRIISPRSVVVFIAFIVLGTVAGAIVGTLRKERRFQLLAFAGILLAIAAAFAQRRVAPARAYLYLQPWMIACACAAAGDLSRNSKAARAVIFAALFTIFVFDCGQVSHQRLLISEDPHTFVEASRYAYELIQAGAFRGDTAILWNSSENIWPPLLYYMILFHPDESGARNWDDPAVLRVFILVSRSDDVAALVQAHPAFANTFGAPRLVQVTANCEMYLALRK